VRLTGSIVATGLLATGLLAAGYAGIVVLPRRAVGRHRAPRRLAVASAAA
jgi:hypothetical protein